jgi:serine/threonine-protein kinase
MEFVLFMMVIFGSITAWKYMKHKSEERMRALELDAQTRMQQRALGPGPEVDDRLRHLESIVTSVDFELNAKLNKLASRQVQMLQPPGESGPDFATDNTQAYGAIRLKPGDTLANRFVIERPLGSGGMGAVYLARDNQLGEAVAVKVIAGLALLDPAATDRFRREASAARRISHGNVVRIHDIGEEKGVLFLSMEYVNGPSLSELLDRHGQLPLPQVRQVAAEICDGLAAAHAQGIVHRDLKPGNVLIDASQRVKLIDFGLARLPNLEGMTATGMIMGTPEYMAPEQIKSGTVDPRSDIYALGALLYHCLCGRAPFVAETPIAVSLAQMTQPPTPMGELRADIPEAWEQFVMRALEKDPSTRYATAQEMRGALPPA